MGGNSVDTATALSTTGNWGDEVSQAYQLIRQYAPNRGIGVQVGEYNWSWTTGDGYAGYQGDDRFYTAVNTVWGASVAGHIAAAGGRGDEYADLNGALGLTFEQQDAAAHYGRALNSPMPIYYGLEMFTGGSLFRGFGSSMVESSTQLNNVEIFAAGNGNIVMINKDPAVTQTASIGLAGFSGGTADVWQTNASAPFSAPAHMATLNVANSLSYTLPPYSVTTFVLNGGVSAGGPATSTPTAPATTATTPGTVTATPGSTPTSPASTPTTPGSTPTITGGTPTPSPTTSGGGAQQGSANACTGMSVQPGVVPGQYTFIVNATHAPGMTDIAYAFHFGDGETEYATSDTVRHSYAPGTYYAYASVYFTGNGQEMQLTSLACEATVTVSSSSEGGGSLLQAQPGNNCQALNVMQGTGTGEYLFTPWTTTAGGMAVTGYQYDFGDGTTEYSTDATVTHSYTPGTYVASVTVDFTLNGVTQSVISPTCTATVSVSSPAPGTVLSAPLRINTGGGPYVDAAGNVWQADQYYTGGSENDQAAGHTIAGTGDAPLFQDERWGNFSYQLPLPNGTYEVRLYFGEIYSGCLSPGCRVFNVTANGQPWLSNYDIAAKSGDYTADMESATVTVTNNVLDLTFSSVVGSPQLAAIEVVNPGTPQMTVLSS